MPHEYLPQRYLANPTSGTPNAALMRNIWVTIAALSAVFVDSATTTGHGFITLVGESDVVTLDVTGVAGQSANLLSVADNGGTNTLTFSTAGALAISGALSKGSGTFDIPHPLEELREAGWRLRHSFVEAPRADNVYSGMVRLNGTAEALIDLDASFNMTPGTFLALNRDPRILVSGNGCTVKWFHVAATLRLKGDAKGTAPWLCQAQDDVTFLVIGERQDETVRRSDFMDAEGSFVPEYQPRTSKSA